MSSGESSIKKLAVRGAVWTIAGYGASQVLRLASNLILTRLLFPDLFGLMSLVSTFIAGLHLFSDVGISFSIVQNKRGNEPDFLNTAWTMQVIRGIGLWICCFVIAWPVSHLYSEPQLLWLLPVVGLNSLISGFNSTAIFTLNRKMVIKDLALFELVGQAIAVLVMIAWAWFSPTIASLVAGGIAASLFQLVWSHRLIPGFRNRFLWDKSSLREIASLGKWIFLSTALTFLAEQADRLILGKVLGFELLGIYGVALTFADLPRSVTSALNGKVVFPAIVSIIDQPRQIVRRKLLHTRKWIVMALAVSIALLSGLGDFLIEWLYDNRYIDAAWMLPILALGVWPRLLCNTNEPALMAMGKPQYSTGANVSRLLCTTFGIWVGYSAFGVLGAVVAVALNDLCYFVIISYGLNREGLSSIRQDLLATGLLITLLSGILLLRASLDWGLPIDQLFQL